MAQRVSSCGERFGVGGLELDAQARSRWVGPQRAGGRGKRAVEEHLLDAGVVMEVLEVAKRLDRAAGVRVELRARSAAESSSWWAWQSAATAQEAR